MMLCGSYKIRCFGRMYRLHHLGENNQRALPNSLILFTLKMEGIRSSETSVLTTATKYHISEYDTLHSHCREKLSSYIGRYWIIF
jgi:hypothetical protein